MLCDLYGTIDGKFGYLSTEPVSGSTGIDISAYFNGNNIVANNPAGSASSRIYFNALDFGQPIPYSSNGSKPHFIISYDSLTFTYNVSSSNPYFTDIGFDLYIGEDYTPYTTGGIAFNFTNESNIVPFSSVPYYTKLGFNEPLIKTSGIYVGSDVSRTINLQRNNPCYTKNLCSSVGSTGICYENTCNLYFNYNPEFC